MDIDQLKGRIFCKFVTIAIAIDILKTLEFFRDSGNVMLFPIIRITSVHHHEVILQVKNHNFSEEDF